MRRMYKKFKKDTGQGLVEFALILPIFLLLIMGMFDYGWLLYGEISVNAAAKEAARIIVVADGKQMSEKIQNVEAIAGIPSSSLTVPATLPASGSSLTISVTKKVNPLVGFFVKGEQELVGTATMRME